MQGDVIHHVPRAAGMNKSVKLFGIALSVAMGGFLVGFDATVISGAVPFLRTYFDLDSTAGGLQLGWAVSSLGWGAMAGNACAGFLSDRFGRRSVLLLTAVLFLASSLSAAFATNFIVFIAARILGGISVGAAILIAPVYIAEIAPARIRGGLVSVNQLMIVIGISVSFFLPNYFLLNARCRQLALDARRAMRSGSPVLPVLVCLCLGVPGGSWARAALPLTQAPCLSRCKARVRASEQICARSSASLAAGVRLEAALQELFSKEFPLRMMLFRLLALRSFQQANSINAIFYHLPTIFAQAGGELVDGLRPIRGGWTRQRRYDLCRDLAD